MEDCYSLPAIQPTLCWFFVIEDRVEVIAVLLATRHDSVMTVLPMFLLVYNQTASRKGCYDSNGINQIFKC